MFDVGSSTSVRAVVVRSSRFFVGPIYNRANLQVYRAGRDPFIFHLRRNMTALFWGEFKAINKIAISVTKVNDESNGTP
jgi:hypothetical protein